MIKYILVSLDGTPLAETAIQPAAILAERFEAEVLLLVRGIETWPAGKPIPSGDLAAIFVAENYLTTVASKLVRKRLTVHHAVLGEEPTSGISAEADFHQADLIVMASHGHSRLGSFLLGSVARSLLSQLEVPILLVRNQPAKAAPAETAKVEE